MKKEKITKKMVTRKYPENTQALFNKRLLNNPFKNLLPQIPVKKCRKKTVIIMFNTKKTLGSVIKVDFCFTFSRLPIPATPPSCFFRFSKTPVKDSPVFTAVLEIFWGATWMSQEVNKRLISGV